MSFSLVPRRLRLGPLTMRIFTVRKITAFNSNKKAIPKTGTALLFSNPILFCCRSGLRVVLLTAYGAAGAVFFTLKLCTLGGSDGAIGFGCFFIVLYFGFARFKTAGFPRSK